MLDVTHELYNALLQERREAWKRRRITVSNKMQYAELNVRLRKGRAVPLKFGRAWIIERNRGWYLSVEYSLPTLDKRPVKHIVGIDRGVHVLGATSEGNLIPNACANERHRRVATRLQRELDSITKKDDVSGRCLNRHDAQRRKAALRLARARERERNARRDHAHKVSNRLVREVDCVALEALNVACMTRSARGTREQPGRKVRAKAALNRVVLDAGFGLLQQTIAYKAESAGVTVVAVNARYSSQECSRCEHIARGNRRRRRFNCVRCGFATHADVNAALVIRRRAQWALMSELHPAEEAGRLPAVGRRLAPSNAWSRCLVRVL